MRLFAAVAGLVAWAVQFTVIYGATAVLCARGYGDASLLGIRIVPLTVAVATALALAATGLVFAHARADKRRTAPQTDPMDRFLTSTTLPVSGFSLVAIAWQVLPALLVPSCG